MRPFGRVQRLRSGAPMRFRRCLAIALALAVVAPGALAADAKLAGCLGRDERRAVQDSGKVIRLAAALRVARSRMAGALVNARLCQSPNGLVYVLTLLAHD